MRILVGTVPGQIFGGIYATEGPFEKALVEQEGFEISVFHFGSKGEAESVLKKICGRFIDVVQFAFLLTRFRPDIIHLNSAYVQNALLRDVLYVLISRLLRRHLFIKYHGSLADLLTRRSLFWRTLTYMCIHYSSGIGVLSSEEKRNFLGAGYPEDRIFVVNNSIDCQRFAPVAKRAGETPTILFISRFIHTKGLLDVISATKIVLDSGKTVKLICVGDGPEMPKALNLVTMLGIKDSVRFEGFRPEEQTTDYYLNSDILAFPTWHNEGFSMVIFQSAAAGLPIITTKIRAAADYMREPDNCLWVEAKNPSMLADKIIYLLDHPTHMTTMAKNNRALATKFQPKEVVKQYVEIYCQLMR